MSSLRTRLDAWLWKHVVRRWFAFEVDTEFLRGVAFGKKWAGDYQVVGNHGTKGSSYYLLVGGKR